MNSEKKFQLRKILSNHFVKFSLVPILIVEITLLILYFSINKYISTKNTDFLLNQAETNTKELLKKESSIINNKLTEISQLATILQKEHESIFSNVERYNYQDEKLKFDFAANNVFYKTNKDGASLYYSSNTKITDIERKKATFTEAMDVNLKNIVDVNPLVVAAYFNSWDNMNRLYPFIDDVSTQYGEHIQMEDYNFYYLADKKHNPEKKAVWTGAYLDPAGLGWMLSCIVPIYKGDFLEGVTGIDITIDSFVRNILNQKFIYDAELFIVDNEGMIIAMPEQIEELLSLKELKEHLYTDSILKTIEKPEDYNIIKNNYIFSKKFESLMKNNTSSVVFDIKDKEYLGFSQNVDETNWKLMILIDKSNILKSIQDLEKLSNKIGYFAIGFLLLFYVVFFYFLLRKINFFSEKITEPIVDLSNQTTFITDKGIEFKNIDTNIEEISQLNNNFIHMLNVLNERSKNLYEAKIEAERANKLKDDFLANMSHELKTPLNSINIISSVMVKNKSKSFNEKELENLSIINKCGENLVSLVNDMLYLTKLNILNKNLDNKTINIKDMINKIYKKYAKQAEEKGLKINLDLDRNLNFMFSDELKINQIINKLLSNAIKFSEKGIITLKIENTTNTIIIIVEDNGIGIEKNKQEEVFERFTQIDSSTTRKYGGVGIGLALCKELVLLLNGEITLSSYPNVGSIFKVVLPKNNELINSNEFHIRKEEKLDTYALSENFTSTIHVKEDKKKILILNNDHLVFFTVIVELKKKYDVKQVLNFEQLLQNKDKDDYVNIIVDISKLDIDIKTLLSVNCDNRFTIIYDDEKDKDIFIKTNKFIKKTISKELIKKIILS